MKRVEEHNYTVTISNKYLGSFSNLLKNRRVFGYFIFVIIAPVIFYAIFSSVVIPYTPRNIELDWVKYNEQSWILRQVISTYIFSLAILATLFFWKFRLAFAMLGMVILLAFNLVTLELVVDYMNIPVILFLMGMMIIIHYLADLGFFDVILKRMMKFTKYNPKLMMVVVILLSSSMAALVDEVTSILFMTTLVFSTCKRFDLDPVPYLIAAIMATNIGSSATVIGNPVGVYTALYAGLTFTDFLKWSTPAAIASTIIIILILLRLNRKYLDAAGKRIGKKTLPSNEEENRVPHIKQGGLIFGATIILLALHSPIENALHLSKNTMLIATPLAITALILLKEKEKARKIFEKNVDWWTLVFFMFLFSMAATLETTGVTAKLASYLINLLSLDGPTTIMSTIMAFLTLVIVIGLMGAFADNIVAVAAMLPVTAEIISYNLPNGDVLWWAAIVGGCHFGNLTPIGSTANIVALSLLERKRAGSITFKTWLRISIPVTLISVTIASFYVLSLMIIGQ